MHKIINNKKIDCLNSNSERSRRVRVSDKEIKKNPQ